MTGWVIFLSLSLSLSLIPFRSLSPSLLPSLSPSQLFHGKKPRVREKKDLTSQIDPAISQELMKIDRMTDAEVDEKLPQMLVSLGGNGGMGGHCDSLKPFP